ncbi:MAG: carboxypeptidase-like regulatory domain-containing protein [Saprospiraceae bacterium]|nr:carboxypeptidase-like regulatory domain-containing protein [Saprospiraceae bacterium]
MIRKIYQIIPLLLFAIWNLNAQSVSGNVTSKDGPLIGANVVASPGDYGTITDLDGNYMLELPAGNYQITISFLGYKSQFKEIMLSTGNKASYDAVLEEEGVLFQDVIVVGSRTAPLLFYHDIFTR